MSYSRRQFIKTGSALAAGLGMSSFVPWNLLADSRSKVTPSDRIRLAAIGINGMGWTDLNALLKNPEVEVAALCDVDENVLSRRKAELEKAGISVQTHIDYRQVLDQKDIDAVLIATPDHWHCLIMTDACSAGKDVYCEKPAGRTTVECRIMEIAQQKYMRAVQIGQWQRSMKHFKDAVDYVHSGKLGKIRNVKVWAYQGWMKPIPRKPDQPVPPGVHYKKWLGPARLRPFNPNRFHFNFRWFYDYAGGLMTDWGVHLIDYALLGMQVSYPKTVSAAGGKIGYPDDAEEWPDTMTAVYDYGDFDMIWEQAVGINGGPYGRDHGIAYIGNNGTLVLDRGGWEVIPEKDNGKDKIPAVPFQKASDNGVDKHTRNFVEVIKSRNFSDLHAPIQAGAQVASVCNIGNIAWRTGKKVTWDHSKGSFTDDECNLYLKPEYHNNYKLPHI